MIDNVDISIIIINFNKPQLTQECLVSIIEKTVKHTNYEIIVVDNASTIGDIDFVKKIDPRIKLIKSDVNLGFSKGNNLGISHANGDVILLLNNDTTLINDAISICYDVLKKEEKVGAVGCKLLNPDGSLQLSADHFPTISLLLKLTFRLHKFIDPLKLKVAYPFYSKQIFPVDYIWGTFFMFERSLLNKLPDNKLPDDFFMYAEDLQWGYEIKKLSLVIYYVPTALVYHIKGQNSYLNQMGDQNLLTCIKRYHSNTYKAIFKSIFFINNKLTTSFRKYFRMTKLNG